MNGSRSLPRLPYILLCLMSVAAFGGPFAILGILRGGESQRWPPDRPVEWAVIGLVLGLVIVLFTACVSIRAWYGRHLPPIGSGEGKRAHDLGDESGSL